MQTKRKVLARNNARERSSSKESRSQKKVLKNVKVPGVNPSEWIRSSATKQSFLKLSAKRFPRIRDIPSSEDLDSNFLLAQNVITNIFLGGNAVDGTDSELKENNGGIDHHVVDTGLSPAFYIPKYVAKEMTVGVDFAKSFGCEDEKYWKNRTLKLQSDSLHKVVPSATTVHREDWKSLCWRNEVTVPEIVANEMDMDPNILLKQSE